MELVVTLRQRLAGQGLDAGPDTVAWHLAHSHQIVVSPATISRILTRAGLVTASPRKRPRSSYVRFQADLPNETWQSDFTHYRLATGADVEVLTWLDDHSRYALSVTAHPRVSGPIVLATFRAAVAAHGVPAATLTDNGMVFTTRLAGGKGGRNAFEAELRRLHVIQKNSRPNHPTTCGKVERFQQTMKNWLRAQPAQPPTVGQLQALLEAFAGEYNIRRPHRSLPHRAPRPRSITRSRKRSRPPAATATPTPGSATTGSTTPASSPCAITGGCTTSASAEPTPEPTSSCSPPTSRSASSTPSPASSCASSLSTRPSTTSLRCPVSPDPAGSEVSDVLRDDIGAPGRIRTCATASGGQPGGPLVTPTVRADGR